ncbi:tumor necrosis factor receptor superfamily member 1A isoform X2 [Corythoichthys intestinalis]|uniref:tumor necrosis factor receptor superfamily member 1A isoform X2 n=1 Tax=Corythoichthys intestinalis TaxID=161448 RepID=UPI0025A4E8F6|nr:tumor necrosis factor receptor superfamily member 1A isoform X2 [Corythoichthys intestinalis]
MVSCCKMHLVFLIMLLLSTHGQSNIELPKNSSHSCYDSCPPGSHKIGICKNNFTENRCTQCGEHTFTDRPNRLEECQRCGVCDSNQVEIRPCNFTSDVVCACKKGYYNAGSIKSLDCLACQCEACKGINFKTRNVPGLTAFIIFLSKLCFHFLKQLCFVFVLDPGKRLQDKREQCLNDAECKRKCATSTTTATTFITTLTTTTTKPLPVNGYVEWIFVILAVVLFCILWLCTCFALYLRVSFCWKINNNPTEAMNGAHSHLDSSPTTLRANVCEETPLRTPRQNSATSVCLNHVDALLTDSQHKDGGLEKLGGHWPPIVLYAIINEVPLRRWKEFLRMLSVADHQLERVELEAGSCLLEKQYQMLRLWSQHSSARLEHILSALHIMDLSGCAQMLQDRLERLHWRDQPKDGVIAC